MLKKAGIIFAGVTSVFMIGGTAMAAAQGADGRAAGDNLGQCVVVVKVKSPVAVAGIGGAVPIAAMDIKPPVSLPGLNIVAGDDVVTVNNDCTGGNDDGSGNANG